MNRTLSQTTTAYTFFLSVSKIFTKMHKILYHTVRQWISKLKILQSIFSGHKLSVCVLNQTVYITVAQKKSQRILDYFYLNSNNIWHIKISKLAYSKAETSLCWQRPIWSKLWLFSVAMYICECWTIKKVEYWKTDAFKLWCWRRLWRVPWTARRSNQSILKETNLNIRWKDWCWNSNIWSPDAKS